jgi:hypothetical protein
VTDRIFLRLNENFALGADSLQRILYRSRRKAGPSFDAPLAVKDWEGISFVRSTKEILLRCMREKGCFPDDTAASALAGYPGYLRGLETAVPR